MNPIRTWWKVAGVLMVVALLVGPGCEDEEGTPTAEEAESTAEGLIDDAADAAKEAAETAGEAAEAAGEAVKDTADKAGEAAKDAAEKAEGAVEDAAETVSGAVEGAKEELTGEATTEVVAILARADALDGAEDKVVTRCGACNLAMDGNDANTITIEGYTMYFCTPKCKEKFEKETVKAILAMEFPEEGETE
jgi:YHS domain-containing protein